MKLWKDGRRSRSGVHLESRSGACSLRRKGDALSFSCALFLQYLVPYERSFPNNSLDNYSVICILDKKSCVLAQFRGVCSSI